MNRATKFGAGAAVLVLAAAVFFTLGPGKDLQNLWRHGVLQAAMDDQGENRKYDASREQNLKAIYVALNLYEDSEGAYPVSSKWMDAISSRLRTTDMSEAEAAKKLVRPNLSNPQTDQHGYAMNDAASGKFKGDLKSPATVLIYESADLAKNAHGTPGGDKGRMGITVGGKIAKL